MPGRLPLGIILLSLVATLAYPLSAALAEQTDEATPAEAPAAPLTLDSQVEVPFFLFSPSIEEEPEVPEMAFTPPDPLEPPPVKMIDIMLDWYLSPQHAAFVIAQARDLFSLQGLQVTLSTPADPSVPTKLLAAGEVDFALSRQPQLHLQVHKGAPLVRIATLIETPMTAVIIAGDQPPENSEEFAALHYGFATQDSREMVLSQLIPETPLVSENPPENLHYDAADALREQRVDAVADGFFHFLPPQLANDGVATTVLRTGKLDIPHYDGLILLANSEKMHRDRDVISHLVTALENASQWIIEHPDEAWQLMIQAQPILDNEINQGAWNDILRRMALRPAALDYRRYAGFEAFLHQRGQIDTPYSVERLAIDPHSR
ncbi:ABC transporter substrate-binding protein [Halomonas sediminis]